MAKASIRTAEADQPVHTRTTAGTEESQVAVLGIDGSDAVVPADARLGLSANVTASALPTGASTAANQATMIGHVDGIETALTAIDTAARAIQAAAERLDDAISGTEMQVDVVGSLPAGTSAIGKLVANSGVDIGDVDIGGGLVAHDAADSGNPVKVGGRARTALPAPVAQDDRADFATDKFGRQLAVAAPLDQRRSGTVNLRDTTGTDVVARPGASTAIVVTRVLVTNAHATVGTKVTIRDGTTAKIVGYAAAVGGGFTLADDGGLFVATADTAVTAICGTTGADVDVTVFGYLIPA